MTASLQPRLCGNMVEILPDRLYFCSYDDNVRPKADMQTSYMNVDSEVHYESFYSDFGPLNLSVLYRFCKKLIAKLKLSKKRIVFYTSSTGQKRVNGAFLIGSFAIIFNNKTAEDIWSKLRVAQPPKFFPFRDAAMGPSTYDLLLADVLRGVEAAVRYKWLDFSTFNPEEYEFYERVENGDFNWILPGKIISFCGPHNKSCIDNGYPYHAPEVYFDFFRRHNVTTIIRLNKKMYEAKRFTNAGFEHVDLFFVDGSTPSDAIVQRFIEVVDRAKGAVAIHCKAGLGRTGTLIACWMMKEYRLTAAECMGWIRICRPGSIIGPQQQFLIEKQKWCWSLGDTGKASEPSVKPLNGNLTHLASKVDDIRLTHKGLLRPTSLPRRTRRSTDDADVNANLEMRVDAQGQSQGDRLLHIKAAKQHQLPHVSQPLSVLPSTCVMFTSPTTPVKPLAPPRSKTPGTTMHTVHVHRQLGFGEAVPANKVARVSVTTSSSRLRTNGASPTPITVMPLVRPRIIKSRATASASAMGSAKVNGGRSHHLRNSPYAMPNLPNKVTAASLAMAGAVPLLPQKSPKGYQLRPRRSYSPSQLAGGKDYAADLPPNTEALLGPRKNTIVDGKR